MSETITVKDVKPNKDGDKLFVHDFQDRFYVASSDEKIKAGDKVTFDGEWKTSKAGKQYFTVDSVGYDGGEPPEVEQKAQTKAPAPPKLDARSEEIEKNMWWKIVADMFTNGAFVSENPTYHAALGVAIQYKMYEVIGIGMPRKDSSPEDPTE